MGGINMALTNDLTRSVKAAATLRNVQDQQGNAATLPPRGSGLWGIPSSYLHQTKRYFQDIALKGKVDEPVKEALGPLLAAVQQRVRLAVYVLQILGRHGKHVTSTSAEPKC